ncbi:acyltransferase domain-containing protein [Dickeya sp. CFBP 2040]|uniref:type I polyketide synthase n=1 Tax=Dickeya sp. CFBP 2040 TaxID=2718531 RepID=UPI0014467487|nr:type I polyketide synthase [Dickeya sp. CFBP 2040]NKI73007.1 acyltransferase domain-containing protein [Dickeya sp. CFBP 2040]
MNIAIVAMQGVFPDAEDVDALWQNIRSGKVSIPEFPPTIQERPGQNWIHRRPLLTHPEWFDAAFFDYTPIEAEALDPQLRLLMEQAWLTLEQANACQEHQRLRTGIFAGVRHSRYFEEHLQYNPRYLAALGADYLQMMNRKDSAATLIAYRLGLGGPAISVNTACSTSLLAVHLACNSLLTWECDVALAGGAAIPAFQPESQLAIPGGFLSPDGLCRPFSMDANGTIDGAGVALVALKRLDDALRDGNAIHGVILGSAVNSDGNDKVGYSAPSVSGQARVITEALAVAEADVEDIGYVETHGTGTQLGDSIEISALTQAWNPYTDRSGFCALGSIKANIGHLGAAAGVTGLIKACCAVREGVIPPLAHCETPHPALKLTQSPFRIPQQAEPWQPGKKPRQAAVSSFGIGGTNVHLILQQPPEVTASPLPASHASLLVLSAKSPAALENQCHQLAAALASRSDAELPGFATTLASTRSHFACRAAIVAENIAQAVKSLQTVRPVTAAVAGAGDVAFLFPGQGSQHTQMTLPLYRQCADFRNWLDEAGQSMRRHGGGELLPLLMSESETLMLTEYAQPTLFATSWALAQWWRQQGIEPTVLLGHSIGEWVAACLAGIFSLDDAMRLVCLRGRLMQAARPGRMLSVALDAPALQKQLPPELEIAVINQHNACVVGGDAVLLEQLSRQLETQGIACRLLHTSHAFHTAAMLPAATELAQAVAATPRHFPSIPIVSNVTGQLLSEEQALSAQYWAEHLRRPVQFAAGLECAAAQGVDIFLECGPGTVLASLARGVLPAATVISSQPHASRAEQSVSALLQAAGELWAHGQAIDLSVLMTAPLDLQRFRLPGYAFERSYHWAEPHPVADTAHLSQLLATGGVTLSLDGKEYCSQQEIQSLFSQLIAPQVESRKFSSAENLTMKQSDASSTEPQNDVQQQITAIWQDVLALPAISPDENFFDLGGHSLWALQIVSKVNAHFGCEIHLSELLHAATVSDLTALVEQRLLNSVDSAELSALLEELGEFSEEELYALLQEEPGQAS